MFVSREGSGLGKEAFSDALCNRSWQHYHVVPACCAFTNIPAPPLAVILGLACTPAPSPEVELFFYSPSHFLTTSAKTQCSHAPVLGVCCCFCGFGCSSMCKSPSRLLLCKWNREHGSGWPLSGTVLPLVQSEPQETILRIFHDLPCEHLMAVIEENVQTDINYLCLWPQSFHSSLYEAFNNAFKRILATFSYWSIWFFGCVCPSNQISEFCFSLCLTIF